MVASDVETLRLPLAVRGYQMAAVDEVLDRLAAELALRDAEIRQLRGDGCADQTPRGCVPRLAVDQIISAPPRSCGRRSLTGPVSRSGCWPRPLSRAW